MPTVPSLPLTCIKEVAFEPIALANMAANCVVVTLPYPLSRSIELPTLKLPPIPTPPVTNKAPVVEVVEAVDPETVIFVDVSAFNPVTVRAVPPKVNVELPNVVVELVKEALGTFVAPKEAESPEALTSNVIPVPATKVNVSIAASGCAMFVPSDQ